MLKLFKQIGTKTDVTWYWFAYYFTVSGFCCCKVLAETIISATDEKREECSVFIEVISTDTMRGEDKFNVTISI